MRIKVAHPNVQRKNILKPSGTRFTFSVDMERKSHVKIQELNGKMQ